MKTKILRMAAMATALLIGLSAVSAGAATITVTTTNNADPGTGTSLVMALERAQAGDTIAFNIPGAGPHYIATPTTGYPWITNDNVTIDGYTQPGASPNTNPIHAANNAQLGIVLDSREGGRTVMNYNTGRPGYGDSENAILGVFNAANVTIKGLCFLGLHTAANDQDPAIYCIAFARDHEGAPNYDDNGHVAGCWFGVEPNGMNVTGGSAAAVTAFRHRDVSGGELPELPNKNLTLGVKAGSANPRSQFNVIVGMSYHLAGEQTGARVSGNFVGVLPNGTTPYDLSVENPAAFDPTKVSIEIGRYNDSTILIGTDGDGINDADEGNVFGPLTPTPLTPIPRILNFYSTGNKQFIIAGNYFGVAVDGVTPFPGSFQILGDSFNNATVRFGSDFNGVSDALEGNLVVNNHPFNPVAPVFNPIHASTGAKLSVRGNSLVNNYPLPVNIASSLFLSDPDPLSFYTPHLVDPSVIQPVITEAGNYLAGTTPVPVPSFVATIIDVYIADPEGITNGQTMAITELTNGFVQGKTYVASFVDDSPADQEPLPGAFRFDISHLNLGGQLITITANYSEQPAGSTNAPTVTSPFSEPVKAVGVPQPPQTSGLTPKGDTIYVNVPPAINNGRTESLGVAIANNGNVMVGWEDDADDDLSINYIAAAWTLFNSNGVSITTNTEINSTVFTGGPIMTKFLSYFRSDGSPTPAGTSWGPKIKANLFGDGLGMGGTSYGLGLEVTELRDTQADAGSETADFPSAQLLSSDGRPVRIVAGATEAFAETAGDIRIGDWDFLGNSNVVVVGESRQNSDLADKFGGAAGGNHAIYRVVDRNGNEVRTNSLVSEVPEPNNIWHGVGVTRNGFAVRFELAGAATIRLFDNNGVPTSTNINLAALTGNPVFAGGGRGDSVGFHGNGNDAYVAINQGAELDGTRRAWIAVINTNGTLRYARAVNDDVPVNSIGRVDAAIDERGRVLAVFDGTLPDGVRIVMGRLFDAQGNPLGNTFYVSEKELPVAGTLEARNPRAALRGNLAAVAWESMNSGATNMGGANIRVVALRLFDTAGGGGGEPALSIQRTGNTVTISWPPAVTGFTLEETSTLSNPTWTPTGGVANNSVAVTPGAGNRFYRLRR